MFTARLLVNYSLISACGVDDFDEEIEDDNASSDSSSEDSVEPISR